MTDHTKYNRPQQCEGIHKPLEMDGITSRCRKYPELIKKLKTRIPAVGQKGLKVPCMNRRRAINIFPV